MSKQESSHNQLRFNEQSYTLHKHHWKNDVHQPGRRAVHESWFREDTIDFWRHERMYEAAFQCLAHCKSDRWLTIGDGRYGLDAIRLMRRGFADVTASDLCGDLLNISHQNGLLENFSVENAECLSFQDSSYDYVLCKESYHHFPRPMLALYEMVRVGKKAIILIEPQDEYIDHPTNFGIRKPLYETDGNFVYTISRNEIEKMAYGMNLPTIAFKGIFDIFDPIMAFELAIEGNPIFISIRDQIKELEERCRRQEIKCNILMAVIFLATPDQQTIHFFNQNFWDLKHLERNPYAN